MKKTKKRNTNATNTAEKNTIRLQKIRFARPRGPLERAAQELLSEFESQQSTKNKKRGNKNT